MHFILIYFNMDISATIALTYFKFPNSVLEICMEGMVSQISDICSSFNFIKCRHLI